MDEKSKDNIHYIRTSKPVIPWYALFALLLALNFKSMRCLSIWNCFKVQILIYFLFPRTVLNISFQLRGFLVCMDPTLHKYSKDMKVLEW